MQLLVYQEKYDDHQVTIHLRSYSLKNLTGTWKNSANYYYEPTIPFQNIIAEIYDTENSFLQISFIFKFEISRK